MGGIELRRRQVQKIWIGYCEKFQAGVAQAPCGDLARFWRIGLLATQTSINLFKVGTQRFPYSNLYRASGTVDSIDIGTTRLTGQFCQIVLAGQGQHIRHHGCVQGLIGKQITAGFHQQGINRRGLTLLQL